MRLTSQVSKWGNSLGIRIPKRIAATLEIAHGDNVDFIMKEIPEGEKMLYIKKARTKPSFDLDDLVTKIDDDNRHEVFDWDEPQGRELI